LIIIHVRLGFMFYSRANFELLEDLYERQRIMTHTDWSFPPAGLVRVEVISFSVEVLISNANDQRTEKFFNNHFRTLLFYNATRKANGGDLPTIKRANILFQVSSTIQSKLNLIFIGGGVLMKAHEKLW
jgi:hypothetical protein